MDSVGLSNATAPSPKSGGSYRSYGNLDDQQVSDADTGFIGINQNNQPEQLGEGYLVNSFNGRINGFWIPRRGVDRVAAPLITDIVPLVIPFTLSDTVSGSNIIHDGAINTILGSCVFSDPNSIGGADKIVIATNSSIKVITIADTVANSQTFTYNYPSGEVINGEFNLIQAFDRIFFFRTDGARTLEWDGASPRLEHVASGNSSTDYVQPLQFHDAHNFSSSKGVVTITDDNAYIVTAPVVIAYEVNLTATGISEESNYYLGSSITIGTSTYIIADYSITGSNHTAVIYLSGANSLATSGSFSDLTGPDITGTGLNAGTVDTGTLNQIQLPAYFDDGTQPSSSNSAYTGNIVINNVSYVISSYNGTTRVITLTTPVPQAGSYPFKLLRPKLSGTYSEANKKVFLYDYTGQPSRFSDGSYASNVKDFYSGTTYVPVSIPIGTDNITFGSTISPTSYDPDALSLTGTFTQALGIYYIKISGHGLVTNNSVRVINAGSLTDLTAGDTYVVASTPKYNKFTFFADVSDHNTDSLPSVILGTPQSIGSGFIRMPSPPWGVYFQRRMWVPYYYSISGTNNSPISTDRGLRDEIVISDILDPTVFDAIENQLRITAGISDYLMTMHPFFNDSMLVFNRNSIHVITGDSGYISGQRVTAGLTSDLSNINVKEVTREAGLLARKSVVTQGNNVLFLSDNGVYGLTFLTDYSIRGLPKPLSADIQNIIDRINKNYAGDSVATFFDNRYWLALPLDSVAGANDATGNNAIVIYNFLNSAWESIDTFNPSANFVISNLIVAKYSARTDLYAISTNGGVHRLNSSDSDVDDLFSSSLISNTYPVQGSIQTRSYLCDTTDRKRFTSYSIQARGGTTPSDAVLGFVSEDPDSINQETTINEIFGSNLEAGNTANIRVRIGGQRGYSGAITFTQKLGRPKITSSKIFGTITNRSTNSQR